MRVNLPVTNNEYDFPADELLMSTTDTKGVLTLPLFRVALNPRFTRPFYAVPRTSAARTASG